VTRSAFAEQALGYGLATSDELGEIAAAFRRWAACADGWFAILNGEIICRATQI
jgi:hypothetical protein